MNASTPSPSAVSVADSLPEYWVWVDLEMTGLDPLKDCILEVAVLITTPDLECVGNGFQGIIHQPATCYTQMEPIVQKMHTQSGLWDAVCDSSLSLQDAENQVMEYLRAYIPAPRLSPLCGNSVHMDRFFLMRYMPRVHMHLHYRNIDVSTVKNLARHWHPSLPPYAKMGAHRALDDILESIAELRYYRQNRII